MRILFHNEQYATYEDSGVATSADAHSLVFDEPNTSPPNPNGHGKTPAAGPIALAAAIAIGSTKQHPDAATTPDAAATTQPPPTNAAPLAAAGGGSASGQQRASSRMSNTSTSTIKQHYYPEGGWGWIVIVVGIMIHVLTHGLQTSAGVLIVAACRRYRIESIVDTANLAVAILSPAGLFQVGADGGHVNRKRGLEIL
ncbi:hypothetical protein quinque_003029 [Culex quinquefasciatus]